MIKHAVPSTLAILPRLKPPTSHLVRNDVLLRRQFSLNFPLARRGLEAPWHRRDGCNRCVVFTHHCQRRTFISSVLPPYFVPPAVFVGLVFALWFYKCCMMIIFQNKIIYMPSVPPFSRSEKISDYAKLCLPVVWREQKIKSLDGTQITLCIGRLDKGSSEPCEGSEAQKHVKILFFQGNASSTPPRLPGLSTTLKALARAGGSSIDYSIIAVSYRGFWTSRGRASQKGIELDAAAALQWVLEPSEEREKNIKLVFWGQSIGAGVATDLAARYLKQTKSPHDNRPEVVGLVLETPFVSIRSMLTALYPQKWLPYRYLWPFLRNWWDSEAALRSIAEASPAQPPRVLILKAGKDEVVPEEQALSLEALCRELGIDVERKDVIGALHSEAMFRAEGRHAVVHFLANAPKNSSTMANQAKMPDESVKGRRCHEIVGKSS